MSYDFVVVSKLGFLFMGCREYLCITCKVSKRFSVFKGLFCLRWMYWIVFAA